MISEKDYIGVYGKCVKCHSDVFDYTCNGDLISKRPEAIEWDWWVSCSNEKCENNYGEGVFQNDIEWVMRSND